MPRELQYEEKIAQIEEMGYQTLGPMASWAWFDDPKHLLFTLARYKFVAKMFADFNQVLEIGCGDAFPSRIVAQTVRELTAIDFDEQLISTARELNMSSKWKINYKTVNPINQVLTGSFNGIYALDVLEHISPANENQFIENMIHALAPHGVLLLGMPSLESQQYASPQSKQGHVNCKSQPEFKKTMQQWFHHVFLFSMNDEVVHTGYHKMAHYSFTLCTGVKNSPNSTL